jgi:hypothetical protein
MNDAFLFQYTSGVIPDLMCWCGKMVEIIDALVFSSEGRIRG